MNKKTPIALVVFIVLLGTTLYILSRPEKGERQGERPRPMPKISAKQLERIIITAKGTTVELERDEVDLEKWKVISPIRYPADKYATDAIQERLAELEFGDLITEQKAKQAEYEVDDKAGVRVKVYTDKAAENPTGDFYLGKVMENFTLFRVAGKDEVYQAVGSLRTHFDRELKNWRERKIFDFPADDARKLTVEGEAGGVVLSRPDEKTPWKVDVSPVAIDQLDTSVITNLVNSLAALLAFDFDDKAKPADVGLVTPKTTIKITLKDNKELKLLIGANKGEDWWVKRDDQDQLFTLKKYNIEPLLLRPVDLRHKAILSFKGQDAVSLTVEKLTEKEPGKVTLVKDGGKWKVNGKEVADASKVDGAVELLGDLTAEGFARHSAKELGMDTPEWRVTVTLQDRTQHVLTVGSVEKDGFYALSRKGVVDLFLLRKYMMDRFLLDPKEFNK